MIIQEGTQDCFQHEKTPEHGFDQIYCTEHTGLEYLKERYPNARIESKFKGAGLCYYVDGSLAMKPAISSHLGYKLCNEFTDTYVKENL